MRISNADALRFEKRISHGPADHQTIHLFQEVVDDRNLVGHFGSAEDRNERLSGIFHGFGQEIDFLG